MAENAFTVIENAFPEGTPYDSGERLLIAQWGQTADGDPFNELASKSDDLVEELELPDVMHGKAIAPALKESEPVEKEQVSDILQRLMDKPLTLRQNDGFHWPKWKKAEPSGGMGDGLEPINW